MHAAVLATLAAAIGIAYANSLSGGFVLDARAVVLENPAVHAATAANVATLLTHDYWHPHGVNGLYRPLTSLSYLANYALLGHGDRPAGYHAVNMLLHAACAALLYALLLRLGQRRRVAAAGAGLFALHPVATEAVTNIVGRADLLAGIGVLGALVLHAEVVRRNAAERAGWRGAEVVARVGMAGAALLGALAKESALVVPALVVTWDLLFAARRAWRRVIAWDLLALAPALALPLAARAWVLAHEWPAQASSLDNPILDAGFWSGRATALAVMGRQLWLLAWPATLSADYSAAQIPLVEWPPDATALLALATAVLFAGLAVWAARRAPAIGFLLLFYLIALLPSANLLVPIGSIMAERFLYLPSAGLAGATAIAAFAVAGGGRRDAIVAALLAAIMLAAAVRTARRNRDWQNDATLWAATVTAAPNSAKAHKAYAETLARATPPDLAGAIAAGRRAIAIRPDYVGAMVNLGGFLVMQGDLLAAQAHSARHAPGWYGQAVAVLEQARVLDAGNGDALRASMLRHGVAADAVPPAGTPPLYRQLGLAQARLGHYDAARAAYEAARDLDPWHVPTYLDLAEVRRVAGDVRGAAATLWQALAIGGSDAVRTWLAQLYGTAGGDPPEARADRCAAARGLAAVFEQARLPEAAARARADAVGACGG